MKGKVTDSPEIEELKRKILRITCFLLYGIEELALMTYIINTSEDSHLMKVTDINNLFLEGDRLLAGLKRSRMIQFKDNEVFHLNHDYFKMVPAVHKEFTRKLNEKMKEIESDAQKVLCKRCGKKRSKDEISFFHCDCGGQDVVVINTDNLKTDVNTIKMLLEQINQILEWNDRIAECKRFESRNIESMNRKEQDERKVTNVEQELKAMNDQILREKTKYPDIEAVWPGQLEPKHNTLIEAMDEFQPKRTFAKISELQKVCQKRKQKQKKR